MGRERKALEYPRRLFLSDDYVVKWNEILKYDVRHQDSLRSSCVLGPVLRNVVRHHAHSFLARVRILLLLAGGHFRGGLA